MSMDARFHDIMRGVAFGDSDAVRDIGESFTEDEHGQLYMFGTAVMSLCLEERFFADASANAIREFVNEMRANYANSGDTLNFFAIEGVIRGFAGDDQILDEVSSTDQLNAQYPIIRKVVAESPEFAERFDDVLREAAQLTAEWQES